jgi:uncharacterized membrane protein YkoI
MIQKPALWISIGLTAFMLFTLTSLLQTVSAKGGQTDTSVSGLSPEIQAQITAREAQYIELINQANAQLLQAQQGQPEAATGEQPAVAFSPEQAALAADAAANSSATRMGEPELVNFEGTVAYEVPYDFGNIYVNATTGEVIFNGTVSQAPSLITAEQAAQIAANYMGNSNVLYVETDSLYGNSVFKVKFANSDAVFVDQYGNILLVRLASDGGNGGSSGSSSSSEDHNDDHEEHDDD